LRDPSSLLSDNNHKWYQLFIYRPLAGKAPSATGAARRWKAIAMAIARLMHTAADEIERNICNSLKSKNPKT
ncbi:MAG: hypothetical protein ACP5O7_11745, partial [Phycisphaerae bacterium]